MRKFLSLLVVLLTTFTSTWADGTPTTGIAKAKIGGQEVDVQWVQLWKDGPRFATRNVGATGTSDKESTLGTKMTFTDAAKAGSEYVWGENWKTPTKDKMDLLNTSKVSCTYTQQDEVWGFKFTGVQNGYTSNSIFLPADEEGCEEYAYPDYWSSSAGDGSYAWELLLAYNHGSYESDWSSSSQSEEYYVRPVYDPVPNYLCFTAEAANSSVTFKWASGSVQKSTNGRDWTDYSAGTTITLEHVGDKVYFKGTNVNTNIRNYFAMTGKINASGDVTSLTNGVGGDVALTNFCYMYMFKDCTSLTTAPNLPSTTLAHDCYYQMFYGCTNLNTAPALPAKTLANGCYGDMFNGCTSLTAAPTLPATELATSCYTGMFYGCTSLTTAPQLPATKLVDNGYSSMFNGCTSLETAPALPATTLDLYCYESMFCGCTSLTTAPELLATELAEGCYISMFNGCTSLTAAPALPATELAEGCYISMFNGCTSLTAAPALPATELATNCYVCMFMDCTSLTTAPNLLSTDLEQGCYGMMFQGCTSLTTAPELPATTLVKQCYAYMFQGCTKLSKVTVKFTDWGTSLVDEGVYPTTDWLKDAGTDASVTSHTFICPAGLTLPATRTTSDVPTGWAVVKTVSTEADLNTAVSNVTADETIQLTDDINLTAELGIASGKDFTLDLNGHVLKQTAGKRVINDDGTLTIKDSNASAVHNFKVDANGLWTLTTDASTKNYEDLTARPAENDIIAVKGGCITGGNAYANYYNGGAILVNGTLNIQGGNIVGNKKDGYGYCAGVCVNVATAKVTMSGGRICGNFAYDRYGGGIFLQDGTLTATGGEISYNNTTSNGGGICTFGGIMELDGCKISYNKAENYGGGLYLYKGTTTVKGSTEISYNEATNGGGVIAYCTLKLLGGKIINNKAGYNSGVSFNNSNNVTVGGTVVVKDNILTDGTTKSDIAVERGYSTRTFNISTETPLTTGANIGISASKACKFTTNGTVDDVDYFFTDNEDYVIAYNEAGYLEVAESGIDIKAYTPANHDGFTMKSGRWPNIRHRYPNAVAVAPSTEEGIALAKSENVTNIMYDERGSYVCPNFILKDGYDFFTPYIFNARKLSYSRVNSSATVAVCLPFDFNVTDVNAEPARLFYGYSNGKVLFTKKADNTVPHGFPCVVKCATVADWNLSLSYVWVTPSPAKPNGTFVRIDNPSSKTYVLAADGKSFVKHTGAIDPFESFVLLSNVTDESITDIDWDYVPTGISTVEADADTANGACYNLAGQRVNASNKGIIIKNGKKYFNK